MVARAERVLELQAPCERIEPPAAAKSRAGRRKLYAVVVLLCLFNLLPAGLIALVNDKTFNDALKYYDTAIGLAQGQGFARAYKDDVRNANTVPPFPVQGRFLFPYVVSRAFALLGPTVQTANAVSALFKGLLVIPLFFLALELFGYPTALVGGLLYTFNPFYFDMGARSMPETMLSFWYYLALLWLVVYARRPRRRVLVLAALGITLAYLTRPEGLFLAILGLAIVWTFGPSRREVFVFLVPCLAGIFLGNWLMNGRLVGLEYTETSLATLPTWWDAYSLQSFDWARDLAQVGGLWGRFQIMFYNYVRFTRNVFSDGIFVDTQTGLLPLLFLPVLLLPLIRAGKEPRVDRPQGGRSPKLLWIITGFMLLQAAVTLGYPGYPALSTEVRHGQIIAPFLLILAGAGLVQLWQAGSNRAPGRLSIQRGLALILGGSYVLFSLTFLTILVNFFLWVPPYRGGVEQGGEWARGVLPPESVVMSRRVTDAHLFSERTAIVTPTGAFADIMDFARQNHVTHILIADQDRQAVPNLVEAIAAHPENFHPLHTSRDFQLVEIRSYDFDGRTPRVNGDGAVEAAGAIHHPLDWSDLLPLRTQRSLSLAWQNWGQWWQRFKTGMLAISHQPPRVRQIEHGLALRLGNAVELIGYDVRPAAPVPGSTLHLTLYWRPAGPIKEDYTVFAHVLCPDGHVCGQADSQPLRGAYPTSRWRDDAVIQDDYDLTIPADATPGPYQVEAGMYLLQTGQRLPVTTSDGQRLEQDRVLLNAG